MKQSIPTGFVPEDSDELDPGGGPNLVSHLANNQYFTAIPCILYTDFTGINYFVIEINGQKCVMPVRTD